MPRKGVSKKILRECLICQGDTRVAYLGIDVCRACSVFYKRAEKGNTYTCRTSTKQCPIGKDISCKRCRFDHILKLLELSGAAVVKDSNEEESRPSTSHESPSLSKGETSPQSIGSAVSISCGGMPILDRLRSNYRTMCLVRLNSELHSRPNPPHPLEIGLDKGPYYPATMVFLNLSNRIFLSAILDFGTAVFPELSSLPREVTWELVVNFFYRMRIFEGLYRALLIFPEIPERFFGGYTTYLDPANLVELYGDAPTGDKDAAVKHAATVFEERIGEMHIGREYIRKFAPSHEEFLVIIAMMFWDFGDAPQPEAVAQLGEHYRAALLRELHTYYREVRQLADYAGRLGELLMFMQMFDRTKDMKEHFEMLRLLDVLQDDSFTYRLQKA